MPGFALNDWQVGTILSMAGAGEPVEGSPLRWLKRYPRPIAPGEPYWDSLVEQRLVVPNGKGWRVNSVIAGVISACARPDAVINVGVGDPQNPGFSIVRRGDLVCECTIGSAGTTKLYFPLTRSAVMLSLIGALSGDDPAAPVKPSGFRFRGRAEDAFVLGAALRELRADTVPQTVAGLKKAVARYAQEPKLTAGFAVTVGRETMESLAASPRKVDAAIKRLIAAGHLKIVRDKLRVSPAAEAAMTVWPLGILSLSHVEIGEHGAVSRVLQAMRCGPRIVVFMPMHQPGKPPEFVWEEVSRAKLRRLVAAMLLTDAELEASVAGRKLSPAQVAAAKKEKMAKVAAAKKAAKAGSAKKSAGARAPAAATTAAWSPTHAVPAGGMAAWAVPDGNQPSIANLDAALPVEVTEQRGAWAHIVCSNGWEAWVDGRQLTPA